MHIFKLSGFMFTLVYVFTYVWVSVYECVRVWQWNLMNVALSDLIVVGHTVSFEII